MSCFNLPKLPYSFEALEPYMDAKTVEIHYSKHHNAYATKLNDALEDNHPSLEEIIKNISNYPPAVRNNGGGFFNHNLFWEILTNNSTKEPQGKVAEKINSTFSSFEEFKRLFGEAAATRFGSGWAWLIVQEDKTLKITSTPNQDNPLMDIAEVKGTPILGLDVWEHAYYLKYQNKRPDYIEAFWNIVNWQKVEELYSKAI